jgi:hypothetical protein
VSSWATLWKSVTCLANFESDIKGRVLLELLHEPDAYGIKWSNQVSRHRGVGGGRGSGACGRCPGAGLWAA